jgi:hypothetical protein
MRRVVELADGWIPMPTTGMSDSAVAKRLKTAPLDSPAALKARVQKLHQMSADAGRAKPPTVAFTPPSGLMTPPGGAPPSAQQLIDEAGELADAGVSQLTISLPGDTRAQLLSAMERYATEVLPGMADLPEPS